MTASSETHTRVSQRARREDIAANWYDVIMGTGFVALDAVALREKLGDLSDRVVAVLFADSPSPNEAEAIGTALAKLRYTVPETLGRTLEMLTHQLVTGLPIEDLAALQPRMATLLGGIATGFLQEKQASTLAQQEAVYGALLKARQRAESAWQVADARYRAIITQTAEGIILADPATARIRESNPAFQQLLGYTQEELTQLSLYDVVAHERASVGRNIR